MPDETSSQDLQERISIIENMLAEGRRHTENWGWTFVFWGLAYYVAVAWSAWGHNALAWPITISIAVVITFAIAISTDRPRFRKRAAVASR